MKLKLFLGGCVGVRLEQRGRRDKHIEALLCVEDDGIWHEKLAISSYWLDEMIAQLTAARDFCRTQEPDIINVAPGIAKQYGWKFK